MRTWDERDAMAHRTPTLWDHLTAAVIVFALGALSGAMLAALVIQATEAPC